MKKLSKILLVLCLILAITLVLVACGDDNQQGTEEQKQQEQGQESEEGNESGGETVLQTIHTDKIRFAGQYYGKTGKMGTKTVTYNGKAQTMLKSDGTPDYSGNTDPERTTATLEFWNADETEKVAGSEGVVEPGTYVVHLIFTCQGYEPAIVKANFIVDQSYSVVYNGPDGMVVPSTNPQEYSLSTKGAYLSDASCEHMKFIGWYTTADYKASSLVTEINGADYSSLKGDLNLYAKFQAYVAYPDAYEYGTYNASSGLPEIPGYDNLPADSVKLIDLSLITTSTPQGNGFHYANRTGDLAATYNQPVQAGDDQLALEWCNYIILDYAQNGLDNQSNYYTQMTFSELGTPENADDYSAIVFWIFSEKATGQTMSFFWRSDNKDNQAFTYDITIDWSGWKQFTITRTDAYFPSGCSMNVDNLRISGQDYGLRSSEADMSFYDGTNRVFFSDFFLVNYTSNYTTKNSINEDVIIDAFTNFSKLQLNANVRDSAVQEILNTNYATKIKDGVTGMYTISLAYKDPSSSYYLSEDVRNCIAAFANSYYQKVAETCSVSVVSEFVQAIANIGDYVSPEHAKAWFAPALDVIPGPGSTFEQAYAYTLMMLAEANIDQALNGVRAMSHLFATNEINCVKENMCCAIQYTAVINAMVDTAMLPNPDRYLTEMADWFMASVDAFTCDGKCMDEITKAQFVYGVNAILSVYDLFDADDAAQVAAVIKNYLAKDSTLEAALGAATVYYNEGAGLSSLKKSTTEAKGTDTAVFVYPEIQAFLYRSGSSYIYWSTEKTIKKNFNVTGTLPTQASTVFRGAANEGALAIVADEYAIVVTSEGVVCSDVNGLAGIEGDYAAYAIQSFSGTISGGRLVSEATVPVLVLAQTNEDETITLTVYNVYYDHSSLINVYLNGFYVTTTSVDNVTVEPDEDLGDISVVALITEENHQQVYTFTIREQ